MPPLPDVAKVLKVALVGSDGINTDVVTRFYIRYSGSAPDSAALDTYAGRVKDAWNARLSGNVNEAESLIRVDVTDLTSATGAIGSWAGSAPGVATGVVVPLDTAVVVSYKIARRYRGGHPRGYWMMGEGSDLDSPQRWTTAFISSVQAVMEDFFTDLMGSAWGGAGTLEHVNVSYFHGFTVVTDPTTGRARNVPTVRGSAVVDPIVALVARLRIGTQRRRLQY